MSLPWLNTVGALVFGSVVGSFLNVCIHRLPKGESIVFPGSHCPRCGARIRWHDNVPILSYLLLRGRCRDCHGRIPPRYLLVESVCAVLCLWVLARYGLSLNFAVYYVLVCALVVVAFIDLDHQIIPDLITYPGIPAGVAASLVLPEVTLRDSLLGALLGGGILLSVAVVFRWIRKKEGMGMGDVKLLAMIGAFLGWKAVVLTLLVSSFLGALVGYAALRLSGKGVGQPIPYGPFLVVGALTYLLGGAHWVDWYLGLGG